MLRARFTLFNDISLKMPASLHNAMLSRTVHDLRGMNNEKTNEKETNKTKKEKRRRVMTPGIAKKKITTLNSLQRDRLGTGVLSRSESNVLEQIAPRPQSAR